MAGTRIAKIRFQKSEVKARLKKSMNKLIEMTAIFSEYLILVVHFIFIVIMIWLLGRVIVIMIWLLSRVYDKILSFIRKKSYIKRKGAKKYVPK